MGKDKGPCAKCGSASVIPDGGVYEKDRGWKGRVEAGYEARPSAVLFKGKHSNVVQAKICGSCGFIEMYVEDPEELFKGYLEPRRH